MWQAEQTSLNAVVKKAINIDRSFSLLFKARADARDTRPLQFRGRILQPPAVLDDGIWRESQLLKGYTELAEQLAAGDMLTVEDVDPEALPESTDEAKVLVKGGKKWEQIGPDAATKVLGGLLTGIDLPARSCFIVIDLFPGVGNFFDAFVDLRKALNHPMVYVGTSDDLGRLEWLQQTKSQNLAQLWSAGALSVPGFNPELDGAPNNDLLHTFPPRPTLNVLTFGADDDDGNPRGLRVPEAITKQWLNHDTFGDDFRTFLDEFYETYGAQDDPIEENQVTGTGTTGKRPGDPVTVTRGSGKKPKVDNDYIVITEEVGGGATLMEVPIVSVKVRGAGELKLTVKMQNKLHISNSTEQEAHLIPGTLLAGFGKGKWQVKSGDYDENKQLLYTLQDGHAEKVVFNGKLMTLLEVVNQRRATSPATATVNYHEMKPLADGPPGYSVITASYRYATIHNFLLEILDSTIANITRHLFFTNFNVSRTSSHVWSMTVTSSFVSSSFFVGISSSRQEHAT